MSQQATSISDILASGTKSLMAGLRPPLRLPRRTVPNCVREPIGFPRPSLKASSPAMKVVVTAPMPGIKTPSLPSAGAIWTLSWLAKYFSFRTKCYNTKSMRDRATATITTLVVDDESLACDELAYLLRDFPEIEVIARASNGLEAVELIRKLEPELVFLDVNMPGLDGMGVVRRLREIDVELPQFIFVTAYDLRDVTMHSLRSQLGVVPQEPFLFAGT